MLRNCFQPNTGNSVVLFGRSKSGKTYFMKELFEELMKSDREYIPIFFVGNPNAPVYDDIRDKYPFFEGFKASIVETCHLINSNVDKKYDWLFIFDDILTTRQSQIVGNILISYRNNNISSMFLVQNSTLLAKNARGNATVYMFGHNGFEESKSVITKFLMITDEFSKRKLIEDGKKGTMDDRIDKYQDLTKDYKFIKFCPNEDDRLIEILDRRHPGDPGYSNIDKTISKYEREYNEKMGLVKMPDGGWIRDEKKQNI